MTPNSDRALSPQAQFFSPALVDALVERETRLRIDYRRMPEPHGESARQFVRATSAWLEFLYVSAVLVESARRHGAKTLRDTIAMGEAICHETHALTSLQLVNVVNENPAVIEQMSQARTPSLDDPIPDLALIVSASDAMVRTIPEKEIIDLGSRSGIPEIGARIQVTLDGIRRFIKRNDPWIDQRLKLVGPEYAAGRLDAVGAAQVLELSVPDAVARLEDCGYSRPPEQVHAGAFSDRGVDAVLLVELHKALFGEIRSHAGKCRSRDFGAEYLQFGPNRSSHRNDVSRALTAAFEEASRLDSVVQRAT